MSTIACEKNAIESFENPDYAISYGKLRRVCEFAWKGSTSSEVHAILVDMMKTNATYHVMNSLLSSLSSLSSGKGRAVS